MKKVLIALFFIPLFAMADGKISQKDSMDCENKNKYHAEIVACLLKKQGDTKKPLVLAYQKALKATDGGGHLSSRLEKSQQSWLSLRDVQCKLESDIYGREPDKYLIEQTCLNYLNKQRTTYLNSIESAQ